MGRRRWTTGAFGVALASALLGGSLQAQDLADFDYEDLTLRGLAFDGGYIWPTRVEPTKTLGVRIDLGYLGPGLRILPRIGFWESRMKRVEVAELEGRVNALVDASSPNGTPPADVDLGQIDWSDLTLGLDAQLVWSIPFDMLSYLGLGVSAHIQNGSGAAISDTFVEDLLDGSVAGFNLHGGLEYPISDRVRIYSTGRYEVMGDLRYFQVGGGLQIMFSRPAPGEQRSR